MDPTDELFARFLDRMEPYDGGDPNTSPDWYCKNCASRQGEPDVTLRRCSRCKVVRYCSVDCQREDFKKHREDCKSILQLTTQLRQQANELRSYRGSFGLGEPHDAFEEDVGHFYDIMETRDYCRTRVKLSNTLHFIAHWYEVAPLIEITLAHRLELLRLSESDNLGIRSFVAYNLLALNRDDDCYDFIKYWAIKDGSSDSDLHRNSTPGQWLYPRGGNKHEDIFDVCDLSEQFFKLEFLAALLIIKLRILAAHKARIETFDHFAKTSFGKALGEITVHVRNAIVGGADVEGRYQQQEDIVSRYWGIMQRNNKTLLPSIINPGPLKSQPPPEYISPGTPSEAWEVLNHCNRHFVRIPGCEDRIKAIVGENPDYDFQI